METGPYYDPSLTPEEIGAVEEALGRPTNILTIHRDGPGRFRVSVGVIVDELFGDWEDLLVERVGDGWRVTSEGFSMS